MSEVEVKPDTELEREHLRGFAEGYKQAQANDREQLDGAGMFLALLVYEMGERGETEVGRALEEAVLNPIQRVLGANVSSTFDSSHREERG